MVNVSRSGEEKIKSFVEEKVADPILRTWKGNLEPQQRSLADDIKKDVNNDNIQVYSQNEILRFLEYGTRPHVITPVEADALRWFNDAGDPVFAQKVQHPGTEPFASLRGAIDRVRFEVGDDL